MTPTINPAEVAGLSAFHPQPLEQVLDLSKTGNGRNYQEELQRVEVDDRKLQHWERLADNIIRSGTVKAEGDADPRAVAILKMQIGDDLGMSPGESLRNVYIIKGVPSVSGHWKAMQMRRAGYSWRYIQHDATVCHIEVIKGGEVLGEVFYDLKRADQAKLIRKDSPWETNPKTMLYHRAIGEAQTFFAPETKGASLPDAETLQIDDVIASTIAAGTARTTQDLKNKLAAAKDKGAAEI